MALYNIFLSHMTDEQKFQLTAKVSPTWFHFTLNLAIMFYLTPYYICQEVIGDLVEGKMALSQSVDVLQDSLLILASKDIKLSSR